MVELQMLLTFCHIKMPVQSLEGEAFIYVSWFLGWGTIGSWNILSSLQNMLFLLNSEKNP